MATSYAKLADLSDEDQEDEAPKRGSGFAKLANLDDEEVNAPSKPVAEESAPDAAPWWQQPVRQTGLAARSIVKGVSSMPEMAEDVGVGIRNLSEAAVNRFAPGVAEKIYATNRGIANALPEGTAQDIAASVLPQGYDGGYQMPSSMNEAALNSVLPKPQTKTEKVAGFIQSVLAGSRMPAPQAAKQAPAGFIPPATSPTAATLKEAQKAGYVVPPATATPGVMSKVAEGIAGKTATAQSASVRNQRVTNELAKKALGLAGDQPITPTALKELRETAGKVYEQIADAGEIVPDARFLEDLAQLGKGADEISSAFPGANVGATKQIGELVDSLLQDKFSSKAALQYLRELRKQASGNLSGMNAADPAKQALGMAQREAAATLEDLIGRHLTQSGQPELAQSFGQARRLIAMSHTVENALNETTGNVVASKLGQEMAKGKPLTGELATAARFARAFPKAAKEVTESMPGISPLDIYASLGTGLATGSVLPALVPAARLGIKNALLSPSIQSRMGEIPKAFAPSDVMGLAPSALIQGGSILEQGDETGSEQ